MTDNLLDTMRRGSVFGVDPTLTSLDKVAVFSNDDGNPDTLKILKSTQDELRKAQETFQHAPGTGTLTTLEFWRSKVAQYSARARARKA